MSFSLSDSESTLPSHGSLILVCGPMFAGKTSWLINHFLQLSSDQQHRTLIINHIWDQRNIDHSFPASSPQHSWMYTHDQRRLPCSLMKTLHECIPILPQYDRILINEAQFFDDLEEVVTQLVETNHRHVVVAGLDGDWQRKPFTQLTNLLSRCDEIHRLRAHCQFSPDSGAISCSSSSAIFSLRQHRSTSRVLIGGAAEYIATCRQCFELASSSFTLDACSGDEVQS